MRRVITSVLTLDVATMFAVRGSMFSSALSPKNAPSLSAPTTFSPAFSPAAFRSSRVASAVPPTTMKSERSSYGEGRWHTLSPAARCKHGLCSPAAHCKT